MTLLTESYVGHDSWLNTCIGKYPTHEENMQKQLSIYMYTCLNIQTYICMYVQICIYVCIFKHVYMNKLIHVKGTIWNIWQHVHKKYTCIHVYLHIHNNMKRAILNTSSVLYLNEACPISSMNDIHESCLPYRLVVQDIFIHMFIYVCNCVCVIIHIHVYLPHQLLPKPKP